MTALLSLLTAVVSLATSLISSGAYYYHYLRHDLGNPSAPRLLLAGGLPFAPWALLGTLAHSHWLLIGTGLGLGIGTILVGVILGTGKMLERSSG